MVKITESICGRTSAEFSYPTSGGWPFGRSAPPPPFREFALGVYPFLELQPFHRVYYRVLEAFAEGRIRRLIVTMPPQHGKSVGATTLLPAYLLGLDPRPAGGDRLPIRGSLASKFNRRVQRILDSREYGPSSGDLHQAGGQTAGLYPHVGGGRDHRPPGRSAVGRTRGAR